MRPELERDLQRLIADFNDRVVPRLRHSSATGLRATARELERFAAVLTQGRQPQPSRSERQP